MMKKILIILLSLMIVTGVSACSTDNPLSTTEVPEHPIGGNDESGSSTNPYPTTSMKLQITVGSRVLTATFADNATARDFASLLPLTVTLNDYASTEKVFDLSRRLSTDGAPAGINPGVGDITYYSPWGNIAIFYKDFRYSSGLVKIAHINNGIDALQTTGSISNIKFELIEK